MDIFKQLAMLSECEVRVRPRLGGQRRLQCCALAGGRARHWLGLNVSGLATQPEIASYGRLRHTEDSRNFLPRHATINGSQHPQSQILRIWFHAGSLAFRSIFTQAAVAHKLLASPDPAVAPPSDSGVHQLPHRLPRSAPLA